MSTSRTWLGDSGERMALSEYSERGYELVATKWRPKGKGLRGEVDLVVRKNSLLVIVEVKRRSTGAFGAAVESITTPKLRRLRQLAALAAHEFGSGRGCEQLRIDLVAIDGNKLEVIEGIG